MELSGKSPAAKTLISKNIRRQNPVSRPAMELGATTFKGISDVSERSDRGFYFQVQGSTHVRTHIQYHRDMEEIAKN